MKVSKIIRQTKEYNSLQVLIDNIQSALDSIEKSKHPKPKQVVTGGIFTVTCGGGGGSGEWVARDEEYVTVSLNADVIKLIQADLEKILLKQLVELQKQQDALEV